MKLKDQVAVVTGGGSGIGRAIAVRFAREGADVIVPDMNLAGAQKTVQEIEKAGRKGLAMKTDVARTAEIQEMVSAGIQQLGKIDVLVNNAGIRHATPLLDISEEEWRRTIDVNLNAIFFCVKEVAPHMRTQNRGKVLNIASVAGQFGFLNRAPYCATKAAVINLTRQMALELCQYNIQVNCIAPGFIRTPLTDIYEDPSTPDAVAMAAFLKSTPAGRWGEPEEIAASALFLCSDEAAFITGATLNVDGGFRAGKV